MPYRHIQQQVKEIALNLEDRGMPCQEISDLLVVSERSMRRWRRNIHQYQSVIPPPLAPQGRPRSIPHEILDALHILLSAEPSSYLQEMQKWLTVEHDIAVSLSTIQRSLNAYGLTHKALSTLARERDDNKRAEWMEFVSSNFYDFQIICTDESYKDARTHSRRFGWSLRGNDAFELTPFVRGDRFSILPALTVDGFIALTVIEGSVDSEAFFQFIIDEVITQMNPWPERNSVLLLDNCAIHHALDLEEILNERGCVLLFLPPYSPDLNPIEKTFHSIKAGLRREARDAVEGLEAIDAIDAQCARITADMAKGFYRECGFRSLE